MTTETLNFTQYCVKYGYPSDYDTLFEAQYNGSLGLAGHVSKRTINKLNTNADTNRQSNNQAHVNYVNLILSGDIIDPSGEYVKESILNLRKQAKIKELQSQIAINQTQITFIKSLGHMAYKDNGKLRKGYQFMVDDYQQKTDKLQIELNELIK